MDLGWHIHTTGDYIALAAFVVVVICFLAKALSGRYPP
jgi:hypothetical protein